MVVPEAIDFAASAFISFLFTTSNICLSTTAYYKGSHGIVLVFDITEKSTFTNIEYWMKNIAKHANTNVQIIIVGNKSDTCKKSVKSQSRKLKL